MLNPQQNPFEAFFRLSQDLLEADAIILGAPGRQGGMCGEMRLFLDTLAEFFASEKSLKVLLSTPSTAVKRSMPC